MNDMEITSNEFEIEFEEFGNVINASWEIKYSSDKSKIAIFVSKYNHCLQEILWRYNNNELDVEIAMVISNHTDLKPIADHYGIPFYHFSITKENKLEQEEKELKLISENNVDTIVLARYMQVLSPKFLEMYPNSIINIHHSFLPAFMGADPYKRAYERGVKLIGATSHYVTEDLDEGPIIEQSVIRITHKDSLSTLIRKGRDLERLVLARALELHINNRILQYGKKTIIFE
jgi:formyltetrahydrofolate deformylase